MYMYVSIFPICAHVVSHFTVVVLTLVSFHTFVQFLCLLNCHCKSGVCASHFLLP